MTKKCVLDAFFANKNAWEMARSMVVAYIDEEDEEDDSDGESEGEDVIRDERNSSSVSNRIARRMRGQQQAHPSVSGQGSISGHGRRSEGQPEPSIGTHSGTRGGNSYASSSVKPSTEATTRLATIAKAWVSKGLGGRKERFFFSLHYVPERPNHGAKWVIHFRGGKTQQGGAKNLILSWVGPVGLWVVVCRFDVPPGMQ